MSSLYWDDFKQREIETITCIKNQINIPIRRVCLHITNKCNFRCKYCNLQFGNNEMTQEQFSRIIHRFGKNCIYHITGGEPSLVNWLYDFIKERKDIKFHLNTNAFIIPPDNIKRLKVSLDTNNQKDFDSLVNRVGAFERVVENIKIKSEQIVTSITCVLSKHTYKNSPVFMEWCRKSFPKLYAVFFSCYKGTDKRFLMEQMDIDYFFNNVKPKLENVMDKESRELLHETIDEKFRLIKGCRFPENDLLIPCYLSMSEKVFDWNGEYNCSHLYRDGILHKDFTKHTKCLYGCNRRLVKFNQDVYAKLTISKKYDLQEKMGK